MSVRSANRGKWSSRLLIAVAISALTLLSCSIWARLGQDGLAGLFGPPSVSSNETYASGEGIGGFDHAALDQLLSRYVDSSGLVGYAGLRSEQHRLDAYIDDLGAAPFTQLGRDAKLALLINAYNAFTLRLILDHYPLASIREIPAAERWVKVRWKLAGEVVSLDQLEHEWLRPHFVEPRIHFALVCAAIGCPPLRNEAYTGARIEQQLEAQARRVHGHARWFSYDAKTRTASLTALYNWYRGDFDQVAGSVLDFAGRYCPALRSALEAGTNPAIEYLDYDWRLNEQAR